MLKCQWHLQHIQTNKQAAEMVKTVEQCKAKVGAFDTETTGLNIALDLPFLYQFGFIDSEAEHGYAYCVDIERQPELSRQVIRYWQNNIAVTFKHYFAHNVKYDLHMMHNYNEPYTHNNLSDTLFYIRYAHDALTPAFGGPPLALKDYAAKYIDISAKSHEKLLDAEKTQISSQLNLKLKQRLKGVCSSKELKELFKDPIMDIDDLPENIKPIYLEWLQQDVPVYLQHKVTSIVESSMIPYNKLNREQVIHYGLYDIVWVLETYLKTKDAVEARQNTRGIEIENKLILPLFEMECTGFKADVEYLKESRLKLKNYIKEQREKLYAIAGQTFAIGQHALIKQIFKEKFNLELPSTSKDNLDLTKSNLQRQNQNPEAIEFISLIEELRTLEKWYSVYILRFIKDLRNTDRLYTTINQVGTVSGRVTSDFQQFPKGGITTYNGQELFKPRRMVQVSGGNYDGIVYLDYSQIELRFQALYTILVGEPDLNLCRAYMPYKCHQADSTPFNFNNPECMKNWNSVWYLDEEPDKKWTPTDVHGATTKAAFDIDETHPDFHDLRYVGKRVNFAKNYGAQYGKICQMFPDRTPEECRKIDAAYYTAFPGVKAYHNYCYQRANEYAHTQNLFGINYYGVTGHKLINMLVQGSAAFYLKLKIIELYEYMKANNVKSKIQMQIHDELSWEKHKDETAVFFDFKRIMEDWSDALVPIVADMELTYTTWAEKFEVATLNDFKNNELTNERGVM
jgi:DNA polymerase-1